MTENNTDGLHSVTYLALIILAAVIFFYLRKRHEHNRLNEVRLYTSVQPVSSVKPPLGYSPQPFQEPGTGLPTFSAQEAGQRKMPKEIDHTNVNRKNLSTISDFANNISTFEPFSRSRDQLNNTTEKMFRDSKRQLPYEPSRLAVSPPVTSPKGWKPDQTRKLSCDSFVICEVESSFRSGLDFPVPSGNDPKGFSHPIVPRNIQSVQVLKETIVTNDQDLTKDLEIEYRAIFNQLDHDSPLRTLGSPIQPVDSKKKINSQDEDQDKSNLSILSKIDSFSKTQNALTQKTKVPPHNQRSTQNKLVEKNEKRAKRNQVFIDNESDDEMIVEDIKDIYSENKRPGKEPKGFESSKKKYLKTNDEQPKVISDTKTKSLEESRTERLDDSDISKASSKKRSTADLSYISERGVNNSMRRYVEKKNMREEANKSNSFIVPKTVLKSMEVEKKPVDPFLLKSEEKPKASLFSAQSPLGSTPTQNKPSNFLFTNQQKSSGIGEAFSSQKPSVKESEKILEEEKPAIEKPGLLQGLKNPVDKKIEEEKESPKPAPSFSLFSQPKPEEKQLSLFSQPKTAETGSSGSLFNKQQPSLFKDNVPASGTAAPQQEEQKDEKLKEIPVSTNASSSLFSGAFGNKKPDLEPAKEQEQKVESKPLFGKTDNGLFSNSGSAFSSSKNELQITKIPSNTENAAPSLVKSDSGLFGKSGTSPSIFGGAFGKPKEETSGLVLQKSSSQVAPDSAPKTDEAAAQKTQEEGAKEGFFNKLIGQKPELNTLFGGKPEEKKETAPSASLGLFSTPSALFKTSSTENLDFSKKSDPFGNSSQPEGSGKQGGLFGQKTEQPLVGFAPTSTGSLFSQRDSKKTDEPKKTEALAGFAKNPLESPKKADNPLAAFAQNPTGNLFGKRSDSPKKADKPTIEPAKAPIANLFGQNPESPKKSEGLFGNLIKPAGEGNKPSLGLFGSSSAFGSSAPSAPANGSSGFGSLFKNDAKPPGGGLFSNLVNNNEAKK